MRFGDSRETGAREEETHRIAPEYERSRGCREKNS